MVMRIGEEDLVVMARRFLRGTNTVASTMILRAHKVLTVRADGAFMQTFTVTGIAMVVGIGDEKFIVVAHFFILKAAAFAVTFIVRIHEEELILLARGLVRFAAALASTAVFISNEMLTVRASGTFMFTAAHSMALIFGINFENLIVGTRWMWMVALAHAAAKINGAHEVLSMGTVGGIVYALAPTSAAHLATDELASLGAVRTRLARLLHASMTELDRREGQYRDEY